MLEYQITQDDFVAAQKLHYGCSRWVMYLVVWGAITVYLSFTKDVETVLIASGLLALVLFVIYPAVHRRRYRAVYAKQQLLQATFRFQFDDEAAEWETESGSARIRWPDFVKFKQSDSLFVLYESHNLIRIVPKRIFDEEQRRAFVEQLNSIRS